MQPAAVADTRRAQTSPFSGVVKTAGIASKCERGEGVSLPQTGISVEVNHPLPARVRDVCEHIADGCSNKEVARRMGCEEATVKVYVKTALRHAKLKNRTELALWWVRVGRADVDQVLDEPIAALSRLDARNLVRRLFDAGVEFPILCSALRGSRPLDLAEDLYLLLRERQHVE